MRPNVTALHHSQCLLVMIAGQHSISFVLRSSGCNIFRRNTTQAASSTLFRTVEHFSFVCGLMIRQLVQALLTLLHCVTHYAQPWSTCRKWLHRTPLQRGTKQRVLRCKVCAFLIHLASCFFSTRDSCMLGLWKLQHMSAQVRVGIRVASRRSCKAGGSNGHRSFGRFVQVL